MKVLFVGINNKKGKQPLDSSTLTGKMIDFFYLYFDEIMKTNLCPFEIEGKYPNKEETQRGKEMLRNLVKSKNPDAVVCLGNIVFENCKDLPKATKINHPSYVARQKKERRENWVEETVRKIKED